MRALRRHERAGGRSDAVRGQKSTPRQTREVRMLEKTPESPLDCKEIQPVHSEGNQPWCSLEGLMLKLKLQYFGHLM